MERTERQTNGASRKPQTPQRAQKPQRKKKNYLLRFLGKLAVVLLILLVFAAGIGMVIVHTAYGKLTYEKVDSVASAPVSSEGVTNILLIGSDSRGDEAGRSDAMILLSVSKNTRKIQMTSLLRDIYVEIPGHDPNRLNAAYAYGGPELLMETIEQNFGVEVNRYVIVDFLAFANLVDVVGGVDLELSAEEANWVNAYLNEYNELTGKEFGTDYLPENAQGMLHLNGAQALAYSRNRYIGSDFERTNRQRKVLTAIVDKLPATALSNGSELIEGLCTNLTTNLTEGECMTLALRMSGSVKYDIESASIPLEGTWKNATERGMAVLSIDFEKNRAFLQETLY